MDISESPDPQQQPQNPQPIIPQVPTPSMLPQMQSETLMNDSMMVPNNRPNELDIDSTLLQQFSCLGTTDHEVKFYC